jgi:hypothetical protein
LEQAMLLNFRRYFLDRNFLLRLHMVLTNYTRRRHQTHQHLQNHQNRKRSIQPRRTRHQKKIQWLFLCQIRKMDFQARETPYLQHLQS